MASSSSFLFSRSGMYDEDIGSHARRASGDRPMPREPPRPLTPGYAVQSQLDRGE
jgi:hypothetical protein